MALQRTFSIIKPDAVAKNVIGEITTRFEKAGLRVVASKMVQLSEREAAGFYAEHPRSYLPWLVANPIELAVGLGLPASAWAVVALATRRAPRVSWLTLLVLAILTACAISSLNPALRTRLVGGVESIAQVIFGIIKIIMWAAPVAAFGGMAYTVGQMGPESLANLGMLMLVFWGTCAVFVLGVLGAVSWAAGFNVLKVIRLIKDELLIIVGTSSSESVLPRFLTKLQSAGASKQTVGMVIPTGYSFNLDGTCIYLTLGALFIIQAGGEVLPLGAQIGLALLMVLTSKGAAGVTGAGLVTLAASLQAFGGEFFTPEAIVVGLALIVGIDRVMSEGRALTNAIGNVVATLVIARWNGELDRERLAAVLDDPQLVEADMEAAHGNNADDEEAGTKPSGAAQADSGQAGTDTAAPGSDDRTDRRDKVAAGS